MELQRSIPPSETTHSAQTYANQSGLVTAASCVVSTAANSGTGVTSPGCKPGQSVWRSWGAQSSESPSQPHQCSPKRSIAALTWLQELLQGNGSHQSNCLRGPAPGFSSRFAPEAFSMAQCGHKAVSFEIRVLLLLDGLPFKANELHLPEASGFEAPDTHLCPFSHQ